MTGVRSRICSLERRLEERTQVERPLFLITLDGGSYRDEKGGRYVCEDGRLHPVGPDGELQAPLTGSVKVLMGLDIDAIVGRQ
jgi:hypothetical protein